MPTINATSATAVNFGIVGLGGQTIGGFTGTLIQRASEGVQAEREIVRNYQGDRVVSAHYDQRYTWELEMVIIAATLTLAKAAASLAGIVPGALLTLTDCTDLPDVAFLSYYEVVGTPKIEATNTTAKRVVIPLELAAGITGVANAT